MVEGDKDLLAQIFSQNIDNNGLDDMDRRILKSLVEKFKGGPVGLESLAVAISEDSKTLKECPRAFKTSKLLI